MLMFSKEVLSSTNNLEKGMFVSVHTCAQVGTPFTDWCSFWTINFWYQEKNHPRKIACNALQLSNLAEEGLDAFVLVLGVRLQFVSTNGWDELGFLVQQHTQSRLTLGSVRRSIDPLQLLLSPFWMTNSQLDNKNTKAGFFPQNEYTLYCLISCIPEWNFHLSIWKR